MPLCIARCGACLRASFRPTQRSSRRQPQVAARQKGFRSAPSLHHQRVASTARCLKRTRRFAAFFSRRLSVRTSRMVTLHGLRRAQSTVVCCRACGELLQCPRSSCVLSSGRTSSSLAYPRCALIGTSGPSSTRAKAASQAQTDKRAESTCCKSSSRKEWLPSRESSSFLTSLSSKSWSPRSVAVCPRVSSRFSTCSGRPCALGCWSRSRPERPSLPKPPSRSTMRKFSSRRVSSVRMRRWHSAWQPKPLSTQLCRQERASRWG